MTATIECAVCGRKLKFDTRMPVNPEEMGWREIPVCEASIKALMERRTEEAPVCPECLKFHSQIMERHDPLGERGGKV